MDRLIDTAFATLLHQHHIHRSFISHQKPFASTRVNTAEIEQTGNLPPLIYLFFFVQTFPSSILDRASESQSYHFSACDLPAEKTKLLKKETQMTGAHRQHAEARAHCQW